MGSSGRIEPAGAFPGGFFVVNVLERVLELQREGKDGVLVTVVEKEGSGPLPAGAKMLVHPDGRTEGTVGGGALEQIATRRALELLREGASSLVHYRLGDQNEVLEGEVTGMQCGGRVSLFYECLRPRPRPLSVWRRARRPGAGKTDVVHSISTSPW